MSESAESGAVVMRCGHHVCGACFLRIWDRARTCPMCRAEIREGSYNVMRM